jgi:hypothetical protein
MSPMMLMMGSGPIDLFSDRRRYELLPVAMALGSIQRCRVFATLVAKLSVDQLNQGLAFSTR